MTEMNAPNKVDPDGPLEPKFEAIVTSQHLNLDRVKLG